MSSSSLQSPDTVIRASTIQLVPIRVVVIVGEEERGIDFHPLRRPSGRALRWASSERSRTRASRAPDTGARTPPRCDVARKAGSRRIARAPSDGPRRSRRPRAGRKSCRRSLLGQPQLEPPFAQRASEIARGLEPGAELQLVIPRDMSQARTRSARGRLAARSPGQRCPPDQVRQPRLTKIHQRRCQTAATARGRARCSVSTAPGPLTHARRGWKSDRRKNVVARFTVSPRSAGLPGEGGEQRAWRSAARACMTRST